MNPQNVLRRGYSITRLNGKAVKEVAQLTPGAMIETFLAEGTIISEVKTKKENTNE